MSKRFKIVFTIRFLGYFIFLSGLVGFIFILGPLVQAEAKYRIDKAMNIKRSLPNVVTSEDLATASSSAAYNATKNSNFGSVQAADNIIIPVSTEFGIVIEKIGANAKIVANINPANEREYVTALQLGVAEALGSTPPGQPGNLYLFSHSTDAPWNIIRFNAIFYLLKELEVGDRVVIFYQNKRYDYIVFDKTLAAASDVSFLTNHYDQPILTLQTCDPPGTLINRLIIRAKLVSS